MTAHDASVPRSHTLGVELQLVDRTPGGTREQPLDVAQQMIGDLGILGGHAIAFDRGVSYQGGAPSPLPSLFNNARAPWLPLLCRAASPNIAITAGWLSISRPIVATKVWPSGGRSRGDFAPG